MTGKRHTWTLAIAFAAILAGCASPSAEPDPTDTKDATPTSPSAFIPDFDLVPPSILVGGATPRLAKTDLSFRLTFPPDSRVDLLRVRDILWDFSGDFAVGPEVIHRFDRGGLHSVKLTVRDVYDRTAETTILVSIAEQTRFTGIIRVGDAGQDARPPDGTSPNDHMDHAFPVGDGAIKMRARLSYSPENLYCPQTGVCVPGEASLIARAFDANGARIAEVATGAPPRLLDTDLTTAGDHILRVSGDKGVDVNYNLTILVLWPET